MGDNGFNDFGGFGDDDGFDFGGDNSGGFGDDFGDTSGNGGFGDDFSSSTGNGGFDDDNAFADNSNQFSDSVSNLGGQNQFQDNSNNEQHGLKKQAILCIVLGIVLLVVIFIVASVIKNKSNSTDVADNTNIESTVQNNVQQNADVNVDNIMSSDNSNIGQSSDTTQNVITNKQDDDFVWTIITDSEEVQFNSEYTDMTFTVTNIEHKARVTDTNNNLVVKTTLQGSISGLSGTYELDVPYNKGVKLVVGNSFTVHVQLGTYNGKTVVGEIKY